MAENIRFSSLFRKGKDTECRGVYFRQKFQRNQNLTSCIDGETIDFGTIKLT